MNKFMDEQALPNNTFCRKIVAVVFRCRVEMQVSARGHGDAARLEGKPLSPSNRDAGIIDGGTEHCAGKFYLALCEDPLTTSRASR